MNPVLAREARQRFRGRKVWLVIAGWVIVVGLLSYLFFFMGRTFQLDFYLPQGPAVGSQPGRAVGF